LENNYYNLIDQTFVFPQEGFEVKENNLFFHGIDLMAIVKQYGTPLKLTYLPVISERIRNAKKFFAKAMKKSALRRQLHVLLLHQKLAFLVCFE
jgi:arginine decarboxylase